MSWKWSEQDDAKMLQLRERGYSHRAIASAINRSRSAVQVRLCTKFGIVRRGKITAPIYETVKILKVDVPAYYELVGWRFAGFDGVLCVFEWHSEHPAKYPELLTSAQGLMEAA
jgi:hypothetical protein